MRQLLAFCVVLMSCGLASSQTRWIEPGAYSEPFTPRVSTPVATPDALVTPSITLDTPSPRTGASNRTVSTIESGVHVNQPLWYAPGVQFNQSLFLDSKVAPAQAQANFMQTAAREERKFESGASMSQVSYGAAQLKNKGTGRKAGRVFTNSDLARLNETNGTVQYAGKLEHVE